jgi:hypothetical protein
MNLATTASVGTTEVINSVSEGESMRSPHRRIAAVVLALTATVATVLGGVTTSAEDISVPVDPQAELLQKLPQSGGQICIVGIHNSDPSSLVYGGCGGGRGAFQVAAVSEEGERFFASPVLFRGAAVTPLLVTGRVKYALILSVKPGCYQGDCSDGKVLFDSRR